MLGGYISRFTKQRNIAFRNPCSRRKLHCSLPMNLTSFSLNCLYSHDEIMKRLNIGNSGGIRVSLAKGHKVARVVLFSTSEQEANPQENPYIDRSEGAILTYTGTGKFGNQNLTGQNLRITQQATEFFPIYVFSLLQHRKSLGSPEKRWRFAGIYKYLNHARENQSDLLGVDRSAWIFKLVRLNISEAGTELEPAVVRIISHAYLDPTLSAQILLEDSGIILSTDLDKAVDKMNSLDPFAFEHFVIRTECFQGQPSPS